MIIQPTIAQTQAYPFSTLWQIKVPSKHLDTEHRLQRHNWHWETVNPSSDPVQQEEKAWFKTPQGAHCQHWIQELWLDRLGFKVGAPVEGVLPGQGGNEGSGQGVMRGVVKVVMRGVVKVVVGGLVKVVMRDFIRDWAKVVDGGWAGRCQHILVECSGSWVREYSLELLEVQGLAKYILKQEGLSLAFSWMCGSERKFVEERRMLHTLHGMLSQHFGKEVGLVCYGWVGDHTNLSLIRNYGIHIAC